MKIEKILSIFVMIVIASSNLALAHADTGNSTLPNDNHIVILPKFHNPPHLFTLKSGINPNLANSMGLLRNDGYCFPGAFPCENLTYHNGTVMHNAKILLVFWVGGSFSDCSTSHYFESSTNDPLATSPNDCSYINLQVQLLKDMCSDPFMKIASQYNENPPLPGAGQCSVFANAGNPWVDNVNPFPHNPVRDTDLQAEATRMLAHVGLSANINTEVFVFTPYGKNSCIDGTTKCFATTFCAYHASNGVLNYANMPDVAFATSGDCGTTTSPNNDPVADLETNPLSHEAMESLTDPSGGGWYFVDGAHEISDECSYDNLVTVNSDNSDVHLGLNGNPYYIQSEWSNSNGGCALVEQSLPLPPSSAPTGITANAASTSSINISWTASTNATSYNIFRSTSSSGPFKTQAGTSLTTSFTDMGLSSNIPYYYKLTASNSGGTSAISNSSASAIIPDITLVPVSGQVGTSVTVSGHNLAANSLTTIKYDGVNQTTTNTNSTGDFNATFTIPSSTPGAHQITATDASNNSLSSNFIVVLPGQPALVANDAVHTFALFTQTVPTISLSPPSAGVGHVITITGAHFAPMHAITIKFGTVSPLTNPASPKSDSTGAFTATFVVPLTATIGNHTLTVFSSGNTLP